MPFRRAAVSSASSSAIDCARTDVVSLGAHTCSFLFLDRKLDPHRGEIAPILVNALSQSGADRTAMW
jgi:hypothetical protein